MQESAFGLKICFQNDSGEWKAAKTSSTVRKNKCSATWSTPYPPHGQGIFTFNILRKTPFKIIVHSDSITSSSAWISLEIEQNKAQFKLWHKDVQLLAEVCKEGIGLEPERQTSYWFSLNRDSLVLKYGKGYFMEETTLLSYDFLKGLTFEEQIKKRCDLKNLFGPQIPKTMELHDVLVKEDLANLYALHEYNGKCLPTSYNQEKYGENSKALVPFNQLHLLKSARGEKCVELARKIIDTTNKVAFYPHPLIVNWPFAVKKSSEASLFELDENNHIFTGSLPPECQELYTNISSTKIELDWMPSDQKYHLSDAIRFSLETEGKVLNEKLKCKKMKYIRVTIGPSRASSPGIPYVLELWPKNNGSPVHCHGNSYGVIKVLHGGIRVEIYNDDMKTMIKSFNVKKGDITWMSPHWYQSHRLFNDTADFCATIQCYRYGIADTKMWPYFDYVNDDGSPGEFLPNSDFTFSELHRTVLDEYSRHNMQESTITISI